MAYDFPDTPNPGDQTPDGKWSWDGTAWVPVGSVSSGTPVIIDPAAGLSQTITAADPADIPLNLKGAALQTANLFRVRTSDDATTFRVGPSGGIRGTVFDPAIAGLRMVGADAQTANLLEIASFGGAANLFTVGPDGKTGISAADPAVVPLSVEGAADQTANLLEVQANGGTPVNGFDKDGNFLRGVNSDITGVAGADLVSNCISLTQAEYDAITPDASTLYLITG